jgi:hypothetical protein
MEAPILFYEPGSPPCRVVLMFLLENGIPHKIQRIKLFEKDHLQVLFFFSTLFPSSQRNLAMLGSLNTKKSTHSKKFQPFRMKMGFIWQKVMPF